MYHPVLDLQNSELRSRVVKLLSRGFFVLRQSTVVFVCGGNLPGSMRKRFEAVFSALLPEREFFEPEFAMQSYFQMGDTAPFDIAAFEAAISELSQAIVLFLEGPGSFAEAGYFSAFPDIAKKTLMVIDAKHQKGDSFISLGPAKIIQDTSIFQPNIQMSYDTPDFSVIATRLSDRIKLSKNRKAFVPGDFNQANAFELAGLIFEAVKLLKFATVEDLSAILLEVFPDGIDASRVIKITSILIGAGRLSAHGDLGHLRIVSSKSSFFILRDGTKELYDSVSIEVGGALLASEQEFSELLMGVVDVN